MRLAICYSTRDQVELTKQTLPRAFPGKQPLPDYLHLLWCDGSRTEEGRALPSQFGLNSFRVLGGPDAAITWKLSTALRSPDNYTHIMLLENDVLLDEDWFEPTMALFEKGKEDGLEVGAVSPRSYVDRVLIQRNGYAVMHNIGAGVVIFTREAAGIVLRTFRTHWWPDNAKLFANIAGIDLRTFAAFRGNEQWVTTDWGWEAQLARHGLASLALTPAICEMIGQNPPLEQQGLELMRPEHQLLGYQLDVEEARFIQYRNTLAYLRRGNWKFELPSVVHHDPSGYTFFPHQLGYIGATWQGTLELKWSQGFGPFAYRAGPGGATLSVRISGICSFLVTGGEHGAIATVEDTRSGFKFNAPLPPDADGQPVTISVPGGPIPRTITLKLNEGAVLYGLHTNDAQIIDTSFSFDWAQLPKPAEV